MRDYKGITEKIREQTGATFRHATSEELRQLRALGLPESVLSFYAAFAPVAQIEGQVMILTIEGLLAENKDFGPGYIVAPHGYIAFADGCCDDPYCFDTKHVNAEGEPRIVLFSHDMVSAGDTPERLARVAKPVAEHLGEFLEHFTEDRIDDECIYLNS